MAKEVMVVECIVLMDDLDLDSLLRLSVCWREKLMRKMGFCSPRGKMVVYITEIFEGSHRSEFSKNKARQ